MTLTLQSFVTIYIIIVITIFLIVYWGFANSINEAECLSISLIIGLIYIACSYNDVRLTYYTPPDSNITQLKALMLIVMFLVSLTIIVLTATIIGLMTFNKKKSIKIFKI